MVSVQEKQLQRGRTMYVCQAALEYLIALAVGGSFLAKLTSELGMSDSLIGVVSAVGSLGCAFQILSVLLRYTRAKRLVMTLSALNQLLFLFLYVIPRLALGQRISTALFVLTIVSAQLLLNIVAPAKSIWFMSLVDDRKRGVFTARKEMFSLLLGMTFSFGMGALFDWLEGMGRLQTAFGLMTAVMTVCMLLATLCMAFTVEKPLSKAPQKKSFFRTLWKVMVNRQMAAVVVLNIIYHLLCNIAIPFYATYQLNELGFSLTLISGFGILSSVSRMMVSPFWGRYADRHGFGPMLQKCLLLMGAAYLCAMMAVPANGIVLFALYYLFHGIAMGGVNSAMFNLIFDYAPPESRTDSLAVCNTIAGAAGFLATLVFSAVVAAVQQGGNQVFGVKVYAQQLLSMISLLVTLGAVGYIHVFIRKKA